ncbi:ABC transporter ATP-binding protein [Clostridia bacterium]|nr:ABC transporter ATP-binding protein [Clostridia bacterium]
MSLIAESIEFAYKKNKPILKGINLKAEYAQVLILLGPNGCGKSTLLDILLGLNQPDAGTVQIEGKDIRALSRSKMASLVSYVSQSKRTTFPYLVRDMIMMGRTPYISPLGVPSLEDEKKVERAMELVGVTKFADRPFPSLSGGEAQLVLLARSLAQESNILVLDEPTAHLDFKNELEFLTLASTLAVKEHKCIVMATHFPNHAFYFQSMGVKTKVLLMHDGRDYACGSPAEVLTTENIKEVYQVQARVIMTDQDLGYIVPQNVWRG